MKPPHEDRPAKPLILLGWDGATPELLEPWMADGSLPNLAALKARGAYGRLRSTLHPLSPMAWTTAMTGLNAGRHGVFDFGHIRPGSYEVEPTTADDRHGATLWEVAGDVGLAPLVVNVPMSYPAVDPQGIFVPGLGANQLEGATSPSNLASLIRSEVPGYKIDVNAYDCADPSVFLEAALSMVHERARLVESLMLRERPDLVVCVFVASDRVQHAFWKQAELPWTDGSRAGWRFSSAILDVYRAQDEALGRLLAAAGDEATTLVVSDHGFGDLEGDLYLNAVLEEMGLLTVRRADKGRLTGWLERLPPSILRRATGLVEAPPPTFGDIVWEETLAYSRGLFGNIWLNLRGREPVGQVEPGPRAEQLLQDITTRLLDLSAPGGGQQPLISAVFRGADLYWGPHADRAPDLVVVPRDYRWMTRSGREIGPPGVVTAKPAIRHTGNHRMDGILVAGGPGIQEGAEPEMLRLLDLCPTALALLGIEVPRGLDGRPMVDVLSCDVGWTDELPWREAPRSFAAEPRDGGDAGGLEDRLKALGYLAG